MFRIRMISRHTRYDSYIPGIYSLEVAQTFVKRQLWYNENSELRDMEFIIEPYPPKEAGFNKTPAGSH